MEVAAYDDRGWKPPLRQTDRLRDTRSRAVEHITCDVGTRLHRVLQRSQRAGDAGLPEVARAPEPVGNVHVTTYARAAVVLLRTCLYQC